jgi:protein-S-isoprenylcysteine O-methyltransferase Ste14
MQMKRLVILLYGVLGYAAFLAAIIYMMGFTSNVIVPKGIDSGSTESIAQAIIVDVALVLFFGFAHTGMARPAFKDKLTKVIPSVAERSTYVLFASLQLAILFWFWQPITTTVWKADSMPAEWLLTGLSLFGWVLVFWSTFLIDHFDLFGLRQVWLNFRNEPYTQKPFTARSLYKYIRHPLMLGFLIAFWATPHMTLGHLVFTGAMTAYILIGIAFEEKDLSKHLGEEYLRYRDKTSMLVPWLKRR